MSDNTMIQTKALPFNFGPLRGADGSARITGPCGDTMEMWITVKDDHISFATYTSDGCYDSIMCGSAAAMLAVGKPVDFIRELKPEYVLAIARDVQEESRHCATLAINALNAAVQNYISSHCSKDCGSCSKDNCRERTQKAPQKPMQPGTILPRSINGIKHKIAVLSGKGGVGKSTVAANLAFSLASAGRRVGLLDVDLHGPSIPKMLGLEHKTIDIRNNKMVPVDSNGLKVISIGFLSQAQGEPLIWRGPIKATVIKQFIVDVDWGDLDFLVVDCPPGTGDEPLSIIQTLGAIDGAVIVTTPQDVAIIDVRKSINFCHEMNTPVLGLIENMSGFACPHCGKSSEIFGAGGGRYLAEEMGIPFLGSIPIDPAAAEAGDNGRPFIKILPESPASRAIMDAFSKIYSAVENGTKVHV